jgi:hypothetical protein
MKTSYILQKTDSSFCPTCRNSVSLLTHGTSISKAKKVAFYICFKCQFVAEIGRGKVDWFPATYHSSGV